MTEYFEKSKHAARARLVTGLALSFWALSARAASEINNYIALTGAYVDQLSHVERGHRRNFRLDFGNLEKNVAMDFRYGWGLGYSDYGGSLKFFEHWKLGHGMGLSLGAGALATFCAGYGNQAVRTPFIDAGLAPFVRFLYDTGSGVGFMTELGVEAVPSRFYTGESAHGDSAFRTRWYLSFAIPFGV